MVCNQGNQHCLGNLFSQMSDEELQVCYGQYLNLLMCGSARKEPLRSIVNQYLSESAQGIVVTEQRLLFEIARRYYKEKGVQFEIDSDSEIATII